MQRVWTLHIFNNSELATSNSFTTQVEDEESDQQEMGEKLHGDLQSCWFHLSDWFNPIWHFYWKFSEGTWKLG